MFSYLVTGLLFGLATATVPPNFKPCGRRNPYIDVCIKDSAHDFIPEIANGVPKWGLPKCEPLNIKEIEIANDKTLTAKMNDVDVFGLTKLQIDSAHADLEAGIITAKVSVASLTLKGEFDGKVNIVVPLVGNGPTTVVTDKIDANLTLNLEPVERKGVKYIYVKGATLKAHVANFKADFKSHKNPGGPLDEGINAALNGDTAKLLEYLLPTLEKEVANLIVQIANNFLIHFTYDELFPDSE